MKREYNFWANERNTPKLKLYTHLAGFFFGTLGLNFLLCFLYGEFFLELEYSGLILIFCITMFIVTPAVMMDGRRENKNLLSIILYGIIHGVYSIGSIILLDFLKLLWIYVLEILIVIFLIIQNHRKPINNNHKSIR